MMMDQGHSNAIRKNHSTGTKEVISTNGESLSE